MVCIPDKVIIGGIVGYFLYKELTKPVVPTPDNSIKIHIDEHSKTDPYGEYDIIKPSASATIKITDFLQVEYNRITTDINGNVTLIYDNRYSKYDEVTGQLKNYIATASKYGYTGIVFNNIISNQKIFQIPIQEIKLDVYLIYSDTIIIIE